jgi:hypothetical protein
MYRMGNTDPKAQFTLHYAGCGQFVTPFVNCTFYAKVHHFRLDYSPPHFNP